MDPTQSAKEEGSPAPATLPMTPPQPYPTSMQMAEAGSRARPETVIVRGWRPEDIPKCRLCPKCTANPVGSFCTKVVPGIVDRKDAALFRVAAGMQVPHDGGLTIVA